MRIIEVRDGFIKLETTENLALSAFLQIDDVEKKYVAQIVQLKKAGEIFVAYAKILFLYDGTLEVYDKSLPSVTSNITKFPFKDLVESFQQNNPIKVGCFINENTDIELNETCLNGKTIISFDNPDNTDIVVSNIQNALASRGNVLVIDMLGITKSSKQVAGVDFKLPLNTDAFNFLFEDCINDATSDSKNTIKEVFSDLAEYSRTVPFVPFTTLKTIVDDMVDRAHVFKLLVLKNKLSKFDKLGYFAKNIQEAENLSNILKSKIATIDLSKLDALFQNRYLATVFAEIEKQNLDTQIILLASSVISKKNIQKAIGNKEKATLFVANSRFKYLQEMLPLFVNYIVEPSFANNEIFKPFRAFLGSMPKNTYLIVGVETNNLPLVSEIKEFSSQEIQQETIEEPVVDIKIDDTEENSNETTVENEKDEHTLAIEKKSEALIEKLAEDINENKPTELELFDEEQEIETENNDIIEQIEESPSEISDEELAESFDNTEEIEEVDEIIEEQPSEIIENISEENEIIEETEDINSEIVEDFDTQNEEIEEVVEDINNDIVEDIIENNDFNEISEESLDENITLPTEDSEEFQDEFDKIQTLEIPDEISIVPNTGEYYESEPLISESSITENDLAIQDDSSNELLEINSLSPIDTDFDSSDDSLEEIAELDDNFDINDDNTILIDLEDSGNNDELDKEIVADVDKVFTTIKEDSISDSDLDFIDELNEEDSPEETFVEVGNEMEELSDFIEAEDEEPDFVETLEEISDSNKIEQPKDVLETKNSTNTTVPVYNADIPQEDLVTSDPIEQGDVVTHSKYGTGVVEKMIKYGTKTLYSINFDNVGRRLLDPTLTEIKKS